ncbi:MAG: tetratricopeptide repeat protein [Armatimonadetes bacterium]|nr:tetratricopeptide repeat protein [Armatimonadota bacterium]
MATTERWFQEAFARHQAGDLAGAEALYRRLLRRQPRHADALYLLGSLRAQRVDYAGALPFLERAAALAPAEARYFNNLGVALKETGRPDEARAAYERALALRPEYPEAFNNLGILCKDQGNLEEAAAWYKKAVAARSDYADAHNNLGIALKEREQWDEAGEHFARAARLRPEFAEAHNNLGAVRRHQGRLEEAAASLERALALQPDYAEAHNNLGIVRQEQDRLQDAEAHFRRALVLMPGYGDALLNLGGVAQAQGRHEEALACFDAVLTAEPERHDAHFNRALLRLLRGETAQGWAEYEWRLRNPACPERAYSQPLWDGSPLAGRTLLVHTEQGFGDTFQFIRYLPLIERRGLKDGGRVIFECQPRTRAILERCAGFDEIIERADGNEPEGRAPHDVQLPLMSLPHLFPHPVDSPPADVPYITVAPEKAAQWGERLEQISAVVPGHRPGNRKVGIVWAGNPNHKNDRNRSASLADFAPLGRVPGVTLYSLQKGPAEAQAADAPPGMTLVGLAGALDDFADTAAVIGHLDLVITVDTSVAHLAGALGKSAWLLLAFVPEWRWLRGRADSPWYPTMRLFRQPRRKDWAAVLARVAEELEGLASAAPTVLTRIEAAEVLFIAKRIEEAKAALAALARDFPPHPRVLNNLGVIHWQEGAAVEALTMFLRALEVAPHDRTTRLNCAAVLRALGQEDDARALESEGQPSRPLIRVAA